MFSVATQPRDCDIIVFPPFESDRGLKDMGRREKRREKREPVTSFEQTSLLRSPKRWTRPATPRCIVHRCQKMKDYNNKANLKKLTPSFDYRLADFVYTSFFYDAKGGVEINQHLLRDFIESSSVGRKGQRGRENRKRESERTGNLLQISASHSTTYSSWPCSDQRDDSLRPQLHTESKQLVRKTFSPESSCKTQ